MNRQYYQHQYQHGNPSYHHQHYHYPPSQVNYNDNYYNRQSTTFSPAYSISPPTIPIHKNQEGDLLDFLASLALERINDHSKSTNNYSHSASSSPTPPYSSAVPMTVNKSKTKKETKKNNKKDIKKNT